jgi:hypothetical protein
MDWGVAKRYIRNGAKKRSNSGRGYALESVGSIIDHGGIKGHCAGPFSFAPFWRFCGFDRSGLAAIWQTSRLESQRLNE